MVQAVVRDARLSQRGSVAVAQELVEHFEDGLARGVSVQELLDNFGSVQITADLIRRAQKRVRASSKARRLFLQAAALAAAIATGIYIHSAVALHMNRPLMFTANATHAGSSLWTLDVNLAAAARARSNGSRPIFADLEEAAALRRLESVQAELASIDIVYRALHRNAGAPLAARASAALQQVLGPDAILLRPRIVATAYRDLLDHVYATDGRLTADGLRLLQAMHGKTHPSLMSKVLEPAYFVRPASREEVEADLDVLLELGGAALEQLAYDEWRALRFFPITTTLPPLRRAFDRAEAINTELRRLDGDTVSLNPTS